MPDGQQRGGAEENGQAAANGKAGDATELVQRGVIAQQHDDEDVPEIDEVAARAEPSEQRRARLDGEQRNAEQGRVEEEGGRIVGSGVAKAENAHGGIEHVGRQHGAKQRAAHALVAQVCEHRGQRAERDKREPEGNVAHADFVEQCVGGAEPGYGRVEISTGKQTAADREDQQRCDPLS